MEPSSEEDEPGASRYFIALCIPLFISNCTKTPKPIPAAPPRKPVMPVLAKTPLRKPPPPSKKKRTVYLTFDDGPNRGTRKLMHIVKAEQVPVTVFLVGEHVYATNFQSALYDSLKACPFFELCNHSYTHAWENHYEKFYNSPDSVVSDFARCRDSLELSNDIVRTPGRNVWRTEDVRFTDLKKTTVAADSVQNAGFTIVGWDLEWHYDPTTLALKNSADAILGEIDSIFNRGKTRNADHLVLLAHDMVYDDPNDSSELHAFFRKIKKKDFNLEVVSHYPGIKSP